MAEPENLSSPRRIPRRYTVRDALFLLHTSLVGIFTLSIFAVIQRTILHQHAPFRLRSFIVPILYGGTAGLLLGMRQLRIWAVTNQLRESEERHRTVADFSSDFVYWLTPEGTFRYVSPACERVTGYTPDDFYRDPGLLNRIIHPNDADAWEAHTVSYAGECPFEALTFRIITRTGQLRWIRHRCCRIRDPRGKDLGVRGSNSDVTEQVALENRVEMLATHDPLTGLPNRASFTRHLTATIFSHTPEEDGGTALLLLDLDRFKLVNDISGHAAGDALLVEAVKRLNGIVKGEIFLARLGGDEFGILLPLRRERPSPQRLARDILAELQRPCLHEGTEIRITGSIGIATFPTDGTSAEDLLKNAEAAMYRAKNEGKNTYRFYSEEMNALSAQRLRLETCLRKGIEQREFSLVYQPQIDMATGTWVGVEALLRWHSPELGEVPPATFIPVAEETGAISMLGEQALREACTQGREWLQRGISLRIGVNLSPLQFNNPDFLNQIGSVVADCGISPGMVELELTESVLMADARGAAKKLRKLRETGFRISIDDFGTGYSSLSYLKYFPLDRLKIDRSFITDITRNSDDATIAGAIIALAHSLRLEVVAEGIETAEQLEFLRRQGCDIGQGYLFALPSPASELEDRLQAVTDFATAQ